MGEPKGTDLDFRQARFRLQQQVWKAHTTVIHSMEASTKFHELLHLLPDPEQKFGLGWARLVEVLAASCFPTDLVTLRQDGAGYLPLKIITDKTWNEWEHKGNSLPYHERRWRKGAVLVDSRHVWDSSSHDIQQVSLECCLTLTMDTDERVASLARATLDDFQSLLDSSEWRNHVDSVVAPRILELLREVSALSKSQREAELRTKLKLICGYLDLGSSTSALGKILVGEVDSGEMRKILIGES